MKTILFCLAGIIVGALIGFYIAPRELSDDGGATKVELKPVDPDPSLKLLEDLNNRLDEKEAALEIALAELEELRLKEETFPSKRLGQMSNAQVIRLDMKDLKQAGGIMSNISPLAASSIGSNNSAQFDRLKATLNLSPEQVTALEEFYQAKSERQSRLLQDVFAGNEPSQAAANYAQSEQTIDGVLDEILTPEQKELHHEVTERQQLEKKEANAYRQLSSLQTELLLDDNQKDEAFGIFYENEHKLTDDEMLENDLNPNNPMDRMKAKKLENERLVKSLSDTLTPTQLEQYQKKLDRSSQGIQTSVQIISDGALQR